MIFLFFNIFFGSLVIASTENFSEDARPRVCGDFDLVVGQTYRVGWTAGEEGGCRRRGTAAMIVTTRLQSSTLPAPGAVYAQRSSFSILQSIFVALIR